MDSWTMHLYTIILPLYQLHVYMYMYMYRFGVRWFHYPGLLLYTELIVSLFIRCTMRFGPSQLSCLGTCSSSDKAL